MLKTRTIEELIDDLDGELADATVMFAVNENVYEIDLTLANIEELHRVLAPFVKVARRLTPHALSEQAEAAEAEVEEAPKPAKTPAKKIAAVPNKPKSSKSRRKARRTGPSDAEVRAWAHTNNVYVGKAGRVPQAVRDQFIAAQSDQAATAA